MRQLFSIFFLFFLLIMIRAQEPLYVSTDESVRLTSDGASHFASLALKCIVREFPNKTGHVQIDSADALQPSDYHPAFYGCFDWHSAVHGHWMLVKLLREFPDMPQALIIREAVNKNITPENIRYETAYFEREQNKSFERTYGWAWLLKLTEELYTWNDPDARRWYAAVRPLADRISRMYIDFLPKQTFPNRTGEHPNTAFGLSLAADYASTVNDTALMRVINERSKRYYTADVGCPAGWEPGGTDFLSPCLSEAELMAKILPANDYRKWLHAFLPKLKAGQPAILFTPATVSDRSDGKLVHLDGLNLSRAWCFMNIARATDDAGLQKRLRAAAMQQLSVTVPKIADGDYAGEHWLASFAVYALFSGQ